MIVTPTFWRLNFSSQVADSAIPAMQVSAITHSICAPQAWRASQAPLVSARGRGWAPMRSTASTSAAASQATPLVMRIIGFCALAHLINDLIQSVLPAIYPMLKANYDLSFAQIGFITLAFQATGSILQPLIGLYTDKHPTPFSLPFAPALLHVFNHGTHHRGQITAALTALGQPCPELDLVYFLQNPHTP